MTTKSAAHNSTYTKGGVSCSKDNFVVNGSLVFQIKFCGKSLATSASRETLAAIQAKPPKQINK
jgi:hypothetical protein